jgi:flagellar biosynthetic protein FliQ
MIFDVGVDLIRTALITALMLAAPILLSGLAIGLLVSLFQTVTSIQEQTLTFVPKIAVMIMVAVACIPWIITRILDFAVSMFSNPL